MTKKEILQIIELKELILDSKKILNITKSNNFEISENRWFPNINDLKEEFDCLKNEIKETLDSVKKAEKKLEKTNDKLTRVNDIMSELSGQLEPLRIQNEKARKYLNLRDELEFQSVKMALRFSKYVK